MSETRVSEPKIVGTNKVRKVRRNRKNYGDIIYYPDKVAVYWSKRTLDQRHRLTEGWLFEADTISAIKLYGVTHVGLEIEDGAKLLGPIALFGPEGIEDGVVRAKSLTYVDPWGRRGAMCWHVPERLMARSEPDEHVMIELLLGRMHIKRDRSSKTVEEVMNAK